VVSHWDVVTQTWRDEESSDYYDALSRRNRSVAVLPKRVGKNDRKDSRSSNGKGYSLPKSFKRVQTAAANSIEQLKKDTETRYSSEIRLKDGEAVTIRFLHDPIDKKNPWKRFDEHYIRENKSGAYVPCIGEGCPLDGDPDARSSRRWLANVLDVGTGEVRLLKMTKAMVDKLIIKYERSGKGDKDPSLMRRNYTIIRVGDDQQTTYEVENEDPGPLEVNGRKVKLSSLKLIDIDDELQERVTRFYGGGSKKKASSRDLDDEDEEDEDDELEDELEDEEDESDEEEDEEDEEDPDEDDTEKPRKRGRKVVAEDEDEDDEDEDDEDDEPVKPKALAKKKKRK
jgi:hypothetical protein